MLDIGLFGIELMQMDLRAFARSRTITILLTKLYNGTIALEYDFHQITYFKNIDI